MQTFLPYPDFTQTAQCLDRKRLGNQRLEAMGILQANRGTGYLRWRNHPAVRMWRGYDDALMLYLHSIIQEWTKRGYRNSICACMPSSVVIPPWIGNQQFHMSHRSNLLRKEFEWYKQFGWKEKSNLPYFWPK